jgi:eukaryotic-like serine/threonine-protein kinase
LALADRWLRNPEPLQEADAGGFSVVYLAEDLWHPGRTLLVKLQSRAPGLEAQSRARLRREHQMLGQLQSPHIIRLHDGGEDPHTRLWYLVLDYHPAGSLARRIPQVFVTDLRWIADVVIGLLKAIIYLHAEAPRPLAHRDVSAKNVLLGEQRSRSILIDLGSARYLGGADPSNDPTVTTGPLYSRYYSPPEMVIPSMLDAWGPATDVYGVAAILYELLTGLPPYQREERRSGRPFEQLVADPTRGPMPARRLHYQLPLGLDALLGACLASEPAARPSAAQMLDFMMAVRHLHGDLRIPLWDLRQLRA